MLDELKSRTLQDKRRGCNFCGDICDSGFSRIEDAKFLSEVSASHGKSKLGMQNFDGEYLQVMGRASCGCIISMRSILMS